MFSNLMTYKSSPVTTEKGNVKSFYQKLQSLLGKRTEAIAYEDIKQIEAMSSHASTITSDDSFLTPVSSVDDLLALSPKRSNFLSLNETSDFLTGTEFDSICDVTMQEVPHGDMFDSPSIDFLDKCSGGNRNLVDRGKESLFVKFDPLYCAPKVNVSSTNSESACDSTESDVGYETGSVASVFDSVSTPKHSLSMGSMLSSCKDKPTQVVPPVVSDSFKLQTKQTRSTPTLVRSLSAILPPTQVATDRLITISGNTPPAVAPRSPRYRQYNNNIQEVDRLHALQVVWQQQQDQVVLQLRQENRELKSSLQAAQHKSSQKIEDLEAKVKKLTDEQDKLQQQSIEKSLSVKKINVVLEEYEKTISSLIGELQSQKIEFHTVQGNLISERDQALEHLSSMEVSFNDLLAKYEKSKTAILSLKEREKIYEQNLAAHEASIQQYEDIYNQLKIVTADSLNKANEELDTMTKKITKLNATIKKHELNIASLQDTLNQKTRDTEELTRICDQLINDVR